jgi:hypothetical protein
MNFPATAHQLAEKGIRESHDHAEEYDDGWTERAVEKVREFARQHETGYFLAESCKAWAYQDGLAVPPVEGAWGQVMRAARSRGIIHSAGRSAATSPGSHGKLMTLWARGPGSTAEPAITHAQADEEARFIHDLAIQMRKEGRSMLSERLLTCEQSIRALASDL